jgi:hypothetical protein
VLEAANVAQEPLTDRSTDPASQLLAPNAEQEDLSVKISDLERKLANELVAIMVSQKYLVVDTTSHIATLQNAHKNIPDIKDYLVNSWKMLEERHNAIIEEGKKVEACRAENAGQVQDLKVCRNYVKSLETDNKHCYTNDGLHEWDVPCPSVIAELQAKMLKDKALYDDEKRANEEKTRVAEKKEALLTEANTKISDLVIRLNEAMSDIIDTAEKYDVEKMKLTAANTKLSALCNHEALARYRNFKGLLVNAELRRLCNE